MPEIISSTTTNVGGSGDDELLNATVFDKYEVGRLLGRGAFAKVYHARDLHTGQSVAIKAISKQRIVKGNLSRNIKREISIMRQLSHPHIVRLHEVMATKSRIYFVIEYAKGGELFSKVANGRFTEDLSRRYFQQLISTVAYCHSRGVFHRDLKPENLLLDENWDIKITDFGLSAVTGQVRPDGQLHTLCGTPAYVAPEILAKKGYDGAKVDIWSCGVILYVLNAGYLPFNDPNLMVMYRKIYKGEFRVPKWTSPELRQLLSRILDPNPDTRITIREILSDPWFKQGYKEIKHPVDREFDFKEHANNVNTTDQERCYVNAFDLISFSSGVDLSGLFSDNGSRLNGEMIVSAESPGRIVKRLEEVGREEGMRVVKKGNVVRLQGQNGNFALVAEISRLTAELVVVEVRRGGYGRDVWKEKIKPRLSDLVYQPVT